MKKCLLTIFGVVVVLLCAQVDSLACLCALSPAPTEQQVNDARRSSLAVFTGKVLEMTRGPQRFDLKVKLRVETVWKGDLRQEVTLSINLNDAEAFHFEFGQTYLVYAYGSDTGLLTTHGCTRSTMLGADTEDIKILGKGKVVHKPE